MEISRFVCFDVETPNRFNSRMSAIGISVIENGKIISEYYSLVNPEQRFDYFNVKLTGISSRLCSYYNIALNHHHADSDASACARILQHYLTEGCDIEDSLRSYDLVACRTKPAGRKGRKKT